jgi:hypothetical protein
MFDHYANLCSKVDWITRLKDKASHPVPNQQRQRQRIGGDDW